MQRHLLVLGVAALAAGSAITAKPHRSTLKWGDAPPVLPAGAQMAVVSGNPGKAEMFKIDLKMPADYAVASHWHPTNETVRVLSGKLGYGMSDKLDKGKARWLTPGHQVVMKAKMHHWVFASGPAEIQVSGMGPFQITYVDPSDDPTKQ
jgi:hypothetical protein